MRRESPAPARRKPARPGMPRAFVFSLAGHFCVALALVGVGASSPAPNVQEASRVEVRVVDDTPLTTADLATAHQLAGIDTADKTPQSRKRSAEKVSFISPGPPPSSETSTAAPLIPKVAAPMAESDDLSPRIFTDGDLGVSGQVRNPAAGSGSGKSKSPVVVSGDHAAGWSPGGPQWENLRAAIQRRVVYPDVARRMGWQGKVIVIFVLQKDGQVSDVRVQAGSGFASLDGSAQQAVERAAPLPPAGESVQIVMPIVFALR
jgi:protein TonB